MPVGGNQAETSPTPPESVIASGQYPNLTPGQLDATSKLFLGGAVVSLLLAGGLMAAAEVLGKTHDQVGTVLGDEKTSQVLPAIDD